MVFISDYQETIYKKRKIGFGSAQEIHKFPVLPEFFKCLLFHEYHEDDEKCGHGTQWAQWTQCAQWVQWCQGA